MMTSYWATWTCLSDMIRSSLGGMGERLTLRVACNDALSWLRALALVVATMEKFWFTQVRSCEWEEEFHSSVLDMGTPLRQQSRRFLGPVCPSALLNCCPDARVQQHRFPWDPLKIGCITHMCLSFWDSQEYFQQISQPVLRGAETEWQIFIW